MKRFFLVMMLAIFTIMLALAEEEKTGETEQHAYAGVNKCKICHKGEKKGMIYEIWVETPHAKAYESLAGEKAQKIYADLGKEGSPQDDPECYRCHITGFGKAAALTERIAKEDGVTCEVCHGAGADYKKMSIMKDREAAVAMGLSDKPREICVTCHNEESPTYKEFVFEEYWKKIAHSRPEKAAP